MLAGLLQVPLELNYKTDTTENITSANPLAGGNEMYIQHLDSNLLFAQILRLDITSLAFRVNVKFS